MLLRQLMGDTLSQTNTDVLQQCALVTDCWSLHYHYSHISNDLWSVWRSSVLRAGLQKVTDCRRRRRLLVVLEYWHKLSRTTGDRTQPYGSEPLRTDQWSTKENAKSTPNLATHRNRHERVNCTTLCQWLDNYRFSMGPTCARNIHTNTRGLATGHDSHWSVSGVLGHASRGASRAKQTLGDAMRCAT